MNAEHPAGNGPQPKRLYPYVSYTNDGRPATSNPAVAETVVVVDDVPRVVVEEPTKIDGLNMTIGIVDEPWNPSLTGSDGPTQAIDSELPFEVISNDEGTQLPPD